MSAAQPSRYTIDKQLKAQAPLLWINPHRNKYGGPGESWGGAYIGRRDIFEAESRFHRFRNVLQQLFPELTKSDGQIESELIRTYVLQESLGISPAQGRLFVKADHMLPVAGSIKARGGIYEVLQFAEDVALRHGVITRDDPKQIVSNSGKQLLSMYRIAVGSTGNLGLSIGIVSSALGFQTTVHMSSDAKEWKKERLRKHGVTVIEHQGDYAAAVAAGRKAADADPFCHFVDDENSHSLFCGYSVAALGLKRQLAEQSIVIDSEHPLIVYLPCGVGGAPGGIAFGLGHLFGADVHCFFAEPTASPCFMVAMMDETGSTPSVYDFGLDNNTEADGLAVPRASERAVNVMRPVLAGAFTVRDEQLFKHLYSAAQTESLRIEPSAAASFDGPDWLLNSAQGQAYLKEKGLLSSITNAIHVLWTTGGLFVPDEEYEKFYARGKQLLEEVNTHNP